MSIGHQSAAPGFGFENDREGPIGVVFLRVVPFGYDFRHSFTMARDKFPMQSEEAKRLAESSAGESGDWNTMETTSAGRAPRSDTVDDDEAAEGLTGRSTSPRNSSDGDDDSQEDEDYLDRPSWESRHGRGAQKALRFFQNVYYRLYGDQLPPSEMIRTLCLASTLFFMIGGYWLLRSLKDPVLTALCGVSVIPKAKMLSVFVVLFVVSIYNRLLDSTIPKHQLFYIFGTFYCGIFSTIALLLMHPTIGLQNEQASPTRILGWISYCGIESFGSVMVSLFWSFANSNISLATAKASYGVMVATAQVGSILGPTLVNRYVESWGVAKMYLAGSLCMLFLQGTMYTYISIYGAVGNVSKTESKDTKGKPKAGILEGLQLFWDHNYVKGIFAISCLFMVEVT